MISSDKKVFEEGSAVRSRLLEYGRLAEELQVIVFAKRSLGLLGEKISPNIFLYSTNSLSRFLYIPYAILCALKLKRRGVLVDVVTTQDPFEAGLAGYIIAFILKARLHIQIHTDFLSPYFIRESALNRIRVCVAKFLIPRANAIRVVSERIKNSLSTIDYLLSTITVLPIFIKSREKQVNIDLKEKYPQFDKIVLVASRLSYEKNIKSVIEAMVVIVKINPKTGLIIIGSGPEESRLKKLVTDLCLSENVLFEGWQDDLSSYYRTADVFVLSSYYEGYGMTVVEAITAGCPIVMTDVGCAGDIVRDGENGLVVSVDDTPLLARAIEKVLSREVKLIAKPPKLPTKEEYLAVYKKSWEDALR